jgi:acyl carrier protein
VSHVTLKEVDEGSTFASFDVVIYDNSGSVLAEIRDFSMMRVSEGQLADGDDPDRPAWLESAIAPREGADAFLRILGDPGQIHVIVSPRPITVVIDEAARAAKEAPARKGKGRPVPQVDVRPVEEALVAHDAVAETAVLAAADVGGGVRLVAFVAFESGEHATVSELRRFVKERVADDLVPKNFVELSALPRGEDGRLLRSELRDPFAEVDDYVAPRTATEKAIATVWEDLLGLERVSVHDNFLDVGGHSLVGIRTIVRIEKETGVRLHANALTLQTLAQLADEIEKRGGGVAEPSTNGEEPQVGSEPEEEEDPETDAGFLSRVKKAIVGK